MCVCGVILWALVGWWCGGECRVGCVCHFSVWFVMSGRRVSFPYVVRSFVTLVMDGVSLCVRGIAISRNLTGNRVRLLPSLPSHMI